MLLYSECDTSVFLMGILLLSLGSEGEYVWIFADLGCSISNTSHALPDFGIHARTMAWGVQSSGTSVPLLLPLIIVTT